MSVVYVVSAWRKHEDEYPIKAFLDCNAAFKYKGELEKHLGTDEFPGPKEHRNSDGFTVTSIPLDGAH